MGERPPGSGRRRKGKESGEPQAPKPRGSASLVSCLVLFLLIRGWEDNAQRGPSLLSQLAAGLGWTFRVGIYQPLE